MRKNNQWLLFKKPPKGIIVFFCCALVGLAVYLLPKLSSIRKSEESFPSITSSPTKSVIATSTDVSPTPPPVSPTVAPSTGISVPLTSSVTPTSHSITSPTRGLHVTPLATEELAFGFDGAAEKPTMGQKIACKCPSFIQIGEILIVTIYVGDTSYEYNQEHGNEPSYDTYGVHGYPNLQVYLSSPISISHKEADDKLIINGNLNEYQKVFSQEEMPSLSLAYGETVSHGKQETVEIDFSNYQVGSSGSITFSFSWDFGEKPDLYTTWFGHRQAISFYVGSQGVSIAGTPEDAYKTYCNMQLSLSKTSMSDFNSCTAKDWYLLCDNELEKEYRHGTEIEKRYEFVSILDVNKCEVNVFECDNLDLVSIGPVINIDGVYHFSVKFRVHDNVELGHISFSVIPSPSNPGDTVLEVFQTIYACNIGQNDYVCINSIDGLANYSVTVSDHLYEIDRQGELVEYAYNNANSPTKTHEPAFTISG